MRIASRGDRNVLGTFYRRREDFGLAFGGAPRRDLVGFLALFDFAARTGCFVVRPAGDVLDARPAFG